MDNALSRTEFDTAIKDALRHYTRTDILAASKLLSFRVLQQRHSGNGNVQDLRALLAESADTLFDNPRDRKIHRVLRMTYFDPAPKQEAAADHLGLSFSTFRRYLGAGVARLSDFLWRLEQERGEAAANDTATCDETQPLEERRPLSLIVLPFLDLSPGGALGYFADSLAESLIVSIGQSLPGSFVVSRSTAFSCKGRSVPPRQIGAEMQVRYVLEGSVLADPERIRIHAQLIDAIADDLLWADRFDKPRDEMLLVQDEAVARLSRSIGIEMLRREARQSHCFRSCPDNAADQLVLRAKALAFDIRQKTNAAQAVELFRLALAADPTNVDAMAGLASTCVFQVLNRYRTEGREQALAEAETLIARALVISPEHIGVAKARAALLRAKGRFEAAIVAMSAVLDRHPGEPTACREIGLSKLYLGETAEAVDWFRSADRIAPNDPGRWTWLQALGRALIQCGRDREAAAALRVAVDSNPAWTHASALLAAAEALSGNITSARHLMQDYRRQEPHITIRWFIEDHAPVPAGAISLTYRREVERICKGLRLAGMPDNAAVVVRDAGQRPPVIANSEIRKAG
jgi:adenylate cyclase